jgi:O-antigen/teichoic acid export membrane protein
LTIRSEGSPRQNGLWAVGQQLASVALSGVFSIVLVRFISVDDFGIYSYATSVAALGAAIMVGGLQGLAIREFRTDAGSPRIILAALFFVREIMALVVYILFATYTLVVADGSVISATLVASLAIVARVLDAPELWFQARLRTRTPALIRISTSVIFFVVRISVLILAPSVFWLIVLFVIEQLINGSLITIQYARRSGNPAFSRPDRRYTAALAKSATPLAISGIANQINLRSDILILQAISGSFSVGLYSAAARLSEILYVLPTAYMNATFPSLLDLRKKHGGGSRQYRSHLQQGFDSAFWFGVVVAGTVSLCATWIVQLLFGNDYSASAAVLQVHVLACPFVFMAAILSKWIVAENRLWLSLVRHVVGAVLSVALNLTLIPIYGIVGSAWATVVSYAAASYLFCFLSPSTMRVALMMTSTPLAPFRVVRLWRRRKQGVHDATY